MIAVDIMRNLQVPEHGNKYMMFNFDYFTKWTEAIAIQKQESIYSRGNPSERVC